MKSMDEIIVKNYSSVLLHEAAAYFTDAEIREVADFEDVGEYGLALQTFVDIVLEEGKHIPMSSLSIIEKLASIMNITEDIDLVSLWKAAN